MKQTVVAQQEQCRPRAAHSQALDLLRFPLAIVVLTVHTFSAMFMNMLLPTMWESTRRAKQLVVFSRNSFYLVVNSRN